ncbi:hypothetical protein [Hymenobacter koreensis]|uniref:Uncharacterized protein n=1 Tax=Hymenobacter koreensis TaxID=1084523 RepID=A0ABP8J3B5_9BACT
MANKQQGQRSQNDQNAAQNQNSAGGQSQSNQSTPQAQSGGSTDGDRSVRSGLSGQASRPHRVGDRHHADDQYDPQNPSLSRGTGMTAPSNKGGRQSNTAGQNNDKG